MAKRYCGDVVIEIRYVGVNSDTLKCEYQGWIETKGNRWHFEELYAPTVGFGCGYSSPEAYDAMAQSAVSFATYYTSGNRYQDVPQWAPKAEAADDFEKAAWNRDENGDLIITRKHAEAAACL